jgi:AcrR family transcriptional regulator
MTEAPDRRQMLKQERRQQILSAALTVFGQKGFHSSNVSDVAAQAGVSQGTIYWYFESKDELLQALLVSLVDDIGKMAIGALEHYSTASDKLRALAESLVGLADMVEGLFPLFLEYWASSSRREEASQLWTELLVQYKDVIVDVVEEGVESGEFRPVDADSLVWALMAAYDGLAVYVMLVPELDLPRISNTITETLLAGLMSSGTAATEQEG